MSYDKEKISKQLAIFKKTEDYSFAQLRNSVAAKVKDTPIPSYKTFERMVTLEKNVCDKNYDILFRAFPQINDIPVISSPSDDNEKVDGQSINDTSSDTSIYDHSITDSNPTTSIDHHSINDSNPTTSNEANGKSYNFSPPLEDIPTLSDPYIRNLRNAMLSLTNPLSHDAIGLALAAVTQFFYKRPSSMEYSINFRDLYSTYLGSCKLIHENIGQYQSYDKFEHYLTCVENSYKNMIVSGSLNEKSALDAANRLSDAIVCHNDGQLIKVIRETFHVVFSNWEKTQYIVDTYIYLECLFGVIKCDVDNMLVRQQLYEEIANLVKSHVYFTRSSRE